MSSVDPENTLFEKQTLGLVKTGEVWWIFDLLSHVYMYTYTIIQDIYFFY